MRNGILRAQPREGAACGCACALHKQAPDQRHKCTAQAYHWHMHTCMPTAGDYTAAGASQALRFRCRCCACTLLTPNLIHNHATPSHTCIPTAGGCIAAGAFEGLCIKCDAPPRTEPSCRYADAAPEPGVGGVEALLYGSEPPPPPPPAPPLPPPPPKPSREGSDM
eukprot:1138055-Pelagomonas_calceolata.AAC.6